jgi:hypothetical protein
MKDYIEYTKGFQWHKKAWYSHFCKHDPFITFGMFIPEKGITGEIQMVWQNISEIQVPRIECFDFKSLALCNDVIQKLAEYNDKNEFKDITEEEFVKVLLDCGFTDLTEYIQEGFNVR